MSGVELTENILRTCAFELRVKCPIAVEVQVGIMLLNSVTLHELSDPGQQVNDLNLAGNASVEFPRELPDNVPRCHLAVPFRTSVSEPSSPKGQQLFSKRTLRKSRKRVRW